MKESFKKLIFYITLSALCVFWAEVVSTNLPGGLINPLLYMAYGLLYILFTDSLLRWQEKDFKIFYLFGSLLGLILETYLAKVTFYGLKPDADRVLGLAPGAIMFVILFYHGFYSFLLPTYMAKRILNIPFAISNNKWADFSYILAPFIILPAVYAQLIARNLTVLHLALLIGASAIILSLWMLLLRFIGDIKNILLSKKERHGLLIFTFLIYTLFLFKCTNKAHGHSPTDIPLIPVIVITIIITLLLTLIYKSMRTGKEGEREIPYSPKSIRLPIFFIWLFWHYSVTVILLLLSALLAPLFKFTLFILGLTGLLTGALTFVISIILLTKKVLFFRQWGTTEAGASSNETIKSQ